MADDFTFLDSGRLADGDLELVLVRTVPADPVRGYVPAYEFEMRSIPDGAVLGDLRFRIGDPETILRYPCHVGYDVKEAFRGHRYAARSLGLILPFACAHGLTRLWICCEPGNAASRRTCEIAGAALCETVDVPESHEMFEKGIHTIRRYWIDCERAC